MKEDKLLYYKVFGPSSLSQKRDAHITKILDFYQTNRKQLNFTFQNIMNKATCFYVKLNSVGMNIDFGTKQIIKYIQILGNPSKKTSQKWLTVTIWLTWTIMDYH